MSPTRMRSVPALPSDTRFNAWNRRPSPCRDPGTASAVGHTSGGTAGFAKCDANFRRLPSGFAVCKSTRSGRPGTARRILAFTATSRMSRPVRQRISAIVVPILADAKPARLPSLRVPDSGIRLFGTPASRSRHPSGIRLGLCRRQYSPLFCQYLALWRQHEKRNLQRFAQDTGRGRKDAQVPDVPASFQVAGPAQPHLPEMHLDPSLSRRPAAKPFLARRASRLDRVIRAIGMASGRRCR